VGYDAVSLDIRFSKSRGSAGSKCPNLFLEVSSLGDENTAFPRNVANDYSIMLRDIPE